MVDTISATELEPIEFDREYYSNPEKLPVLLENEATDWPAAKKWNPEFLDCMLGHQDVVVSVLKENVLSLNHRENVEEKSMPFSEACQHICEHGNYYIAQAAIRYPATKRILEGARADFSRLAPDIRRPRFFDDVSKQPFVTNLWFGGNECKTPLHYDDKENFFVQLHGKKRFILFSPSQTEYLYQAHGETYDHLSRVNVFNPDEAKYPRYSQADAMEVVVAPGDMLYIPEGWWHAVETLTTSISVNFWWTGLRRHLRDELRVISKRIESVLPGNGYPTIPG